MAELLPVFGISLRTFMRLKTDTAKRLDAEQSARVWQFAELFAKAEDVLGGPERAVEWLREPAMALEQHRPIELLTTSVGMQLVDDVIERMRYGVYQ
jgi:putative toxin-antitoxin system antitoxin component (TIGR02293 family)